MISAKMLITRPEYDEAVALLPDAHTYRGEQVLVWVLRDLTTTAWRFYFEPEEVMPPHPVSVVFDRVPPGEVGFGLEEDRAVWKLAGWYRVV